MTVGYKFVFQINFKVHLLVQSNTSLQMESVALALNLVES